ncbi:MAG: NAD-dependent succinate-semialdehyde dehydrogenase [Candidatus Micrarchaeaceae archaeon]
MAIQSVNPATGEVNKEFELFSREQLDGICAASADAFRGWSALAIEERTAMLLKLASSLRSNKDRYARLMTIEMGKPYKEALAEVEKCAWTCEVYAANSKEWLRDETVDTGAGRSFVAFEPIGAVLAVMPWNFPFWQAMRCAIPALAVGNTVILRHSNSVPLCALAIEESFKNAGFPENAFRTVITDHGAIKRMINSGFIEGVSVTGSIDAGREIAKAAARNIKRCVLELGGSDPFIVLDDADMRLACKMAKEGRNISSGQSCIAAKRFIVVRKVSKEFTEGLVGLTKAVRVGDPMDERTEVGPLANAQQLERLESQVNDAAAKGATVECGGRRINGKGCFYEPTVLTNVKKSMRVAKEEVFGPVSPIIVARDEDDAVRIANSTSYGLGASVWTNDRRKGESIARRLQAGLVYVNGIVKSDPRIPFGGIKRSGLGRELSRYGLLEFANIKPIVIS